jgi:hypothetical protein
MSNKKVQTSAQKTNDLDIHTETIKDCINSISKQFLLIGYELWHLKKSELYKISGYKNISDYAFDQFNFKKRSTYNFIAIVEKFCIYDKFGYPTHEIKSDYKDYNYSQLTEMLSLSDDHKKLVDSGMPVKQIREVKKSVVSDSKENIVEVIFDDVEEEKVSKIYTENADFKDKFLDYLKEKLDYYSDFKKGFKKTDSYYLLVSGKIDAFEEIFIDIEKLN